MTRILASACAVLTLAVGPAFAQEARECVDLIGRTVQRHDARRAWRTERRKRAELRLRGSDEAFVGGRKLGGVPLTKLGEAWESVI